MTDHNHDARIGFSEPMRLDHARQGLCGRGASELRPHVIKAGSCRACTICRHPQRTAIETALVAGNPFRIIARRFGTSPAAVFRHKGHFAKLLPTTRPSAHSTRRDERPHARTRVREPPLFPEITHVKKRAFLMGFVRTGSRVKAVTLAQMDDRMHWHWLKTDPRYTAAFARAEQMAGDCVEDRLYALAWHCQLVERDLSRALSTYWGDRWNRLVKWDAELISRPFCGPQWDV